jgi:predicted ATP-grasp superfamily ATP-dependent carboligase
LAHAAANAGYRPQVFDLFGDTDTFSAAAAVHVVDALPGLQFDPDAVMAAVRAISVEHGDMPLVWGAGLEQQPNLLYVLQQYFEVAGCSAETLFKIVDPYAFGRALDTLEIPHPRVRSRHPGNGGRWLVKTMGGCGGAHVREADNTIHHGQREYLQGFEDGASMSVVFIADQEGVQVLGFLEHLSLQPDPGSPFRYGGAVVSPRLKAGVRERVGDHARRLGAYFQLKGLCGVDFVLGADDEVTIVELNPRPTATSALLTSPGQTFAAHMAACLHGRRLYSKISCDSGAHAVVYAHIPAVVADDIQWPAWVADRPRAGTSFNIGDPLCSISAVANTPAAARRLLEKRFVMVQRQFVEKVTPD